MISSTLLTCNPANMPNDPTIPNPLTTALGTWWTHQNSGVVLNIPAKTDGNTHGLVVQAGQLSVVTNLDTTPSSPMILNPGDVFDYSKAAGVGQCSVTNTVANSSYMTIIKIGANMQTVAQNLATLVSTGQTLEAEIGSLAAANTGSNPIT